MNESSDQTLVVFTTAPTGLGHIRVMDAIKDGLYPGVKNETVGLHNVDANKIHALGSRIPFLTKITEFSQTNPILEWLVTNIYIHYLQSHKKDFLEDLTTVAKKHPDAKFWVVIS